MPVLVSMLRGINLAAHHRIKMDALRTLYESLGLRDIAIYIQSGNIVFRTTARDPVKIAAQIEDAIESSFGFRAAALLRTPAELRAVVSASPFAARSDIEPG